MALAWAAAHDGVLAVRMAQALGWWWWLSHRLPGQRWLLGEIAGRAEPGSQEWCLARCWLGRALMFGGDLAGALDQFTAVVEAIGDQGPSRVLADSLTESSVVLLTIGRLTEGPRRAAAHWLWPGS
jgi:hypothetical protein